MNFVERIFAGINPVATPYIYLALGFAALILCGNLLVTGSIQIARHLKISTLVVGLTIVAYATSAPEMFIGVGAALNDAHDIVLGNVIGSNIANISFILALVVLISPIPIRNKSIGLDYLVMLIVTVLMFVFALNGVIGRFEGIFFVAALAAYTVWSVRRSKKQLAAVKTEPATMKPLTAVALVLVSVIGLYFGSGWFVDGARGIASQWGVSERVIAISIVAVGTSMPELVASLVAAFRKEADLSVGNIIGSNLFNIAGVLGVSAIARPIAIANRSLFVSDMIWLFGVSIALFLTMVPLSKGKINRWEGFLLILVFTIYMVILFR